MKRIVLTMLGAIILASTSAVWALETLELSEPPQATEIVETIKDPQEPKKAPVRAEKPSEKKLDPILDNPNQCDLATQWVWEDYTCHDKIVGIASNPQSEAPSSSNVDIAREKAIERGWGGEEWQCLHSLWMKESGFNHLAENPVTGAYGIPQSLPAHKMSAIAGDYRTNPRTQVEWGLQYIAGKYTRPCVAWSHSQQVDWY